MTHPAHVAAFPDPAPDPAAPAAVERHYTPGAASDLLALSIPTLRRLERDGLLRGVRLAGRLRFPAGAIQAYLDTLEVPEGQRFERRITG